MKKYIFLLICLLCTWCSRETADNTVSQNKTILALGDSITFGYGLDSQDAYPAQLEKLLKSKWYDYSILNAGVSGETSADLLARVETVLADMAELPGIALLVIGGNDWLRKMSIDDMQHNIESIIDILKAHNIEVVLGWMELHIALWWTYSGEFQDAYPKIAKNKDVYFLESFLEWVKWEKELNLDDRIHPNAQGYAIISEHIYDFLVENELVQQ